MADFRQIIRHRAKLRRTKTGIGGWKASVQHDKVVANGWQSTGISYRG